MSSNESSRGRSTPCGATGFKLFGVQIDVGRGGGSAVAGGESSIRKCKSLGNLGACNPGNTADEAAGYLSDGFVHQCSKSHERKKGKPWSEEEHTAFLEGLAELGKGNWKGIANKFVPSRNSSQVASHAQKYFIRMAAIEKKRRRSSVFDIPLNKAKQPSKVVPSSQSNKAADQSSQPGADPAASSENITERTGQANMPAPPVATCERPPLSPMKRCGDPAFRGFVYAPGLVTSFTRGFPTTTTTAPTFTPTVSWVPYVSFLSKSSSPVIPDIHGNLTTTFTTFLPPPSHQRPPDAGSAPAHPSTKNDHELILKCLTLGN